MSIDQMPETLNLPPLPVTPALPELAAALAQGHAVLTAPPGSGKTTQVPLALLTAPWLAGGKILMLEPRRPAARMAARRLAQLSGGEPGGLVGYQVRLERRIGPQTRIEVVTEGILTRRLQADPTLEGVGLVIFDEFHERNLQADLGLALCLDVCASLRDDLRLLVMSATLDPAPLCQLLGARHVAAAGRQYPVTVHYLPPQDRREPLAVLPSLVRRALDETGDDVLVFLPGRGEINRLTEALADLPVTVAALYGDLPAAEQDRILTPPSPGQPRRVILSTDLAESSLTIAGIGAVVDSGLARKPVFDPNSGMTRLQRQAISVASAEQRAGRAGRLGPGECYRAWSEARQARLLAATSPEIATSDLAGLVLELALWGVSDPARLPWLDAPPAPHWQQAVALLQDLCALGADGQLTAIGRRMAGLGLEPRLARMLVSAQNQAEGQLLCDLAALLSERDPLQRPAVDRAPADLALRLEALQELRATGKTPAGSDKRGLAAVARLAASLRRRLGKLPEGVPRSAGLLLSLAFPDRIARQRKGQGGPGRFLLANGRGAVLDEADGLAARPWLAVAALDAGRREGRIWSALAVAQEDLETGHAERLKVVDELVWDAQRETVVARQQRRLGALLLDERQSRPGDLPAAQAMLLQQLEQRWPEGLHWSPAARQLQARVSRMRALEPESEWPDLSDASLRAGLSVWLAPWLGDRMSLAALRELDLCRILLGELGWQAQQRLDEALPTHFETPAGSRRAIDYQADGPPRVAVPLQEMFGQRETPRLASGRVPLVLELLNPAQRPIQVTADLANFWQGAYGEVRKELRGRYPKHDWPEDPAATPARRGTGRPRRAR
jgi:ATP-dependent helicase HrpB